MKPTDKPAFLLQLTRTAAIYNRFEQPRAWFDGYWDTLHEVMSIEEFTSAIRTCALADDKFLPTPGQILAAVPGRTNAVEAWGKIRKLIKDFGYPNPSGAFAKMTEAEKIAVRGLGQWSDLCDADPTHLDFQGKVFASLLESAERRLAHAPKRTQIEAPKDGKVLPFAHGEPANDVRALLRDLANGTAAETWPEREKVKAGT